MRHGSLFTGIGGFDLGFQWAGIETAWQVERNPFCLRVLKKNFPEAQRFTDIKKCGGHNLERVDIISGGFPCQDISVAGNKAGLDGKRSRLWFEMARIISELRPAWVLIENSDRLLRTDDGDQVLAEMGEAGYARWPLVLEAGALGATHGRPRAWILCHRRDADSNAPAQAGMGALAQEIEEALARAVERWNERAKELATGTPSLESDAYARVIREGNGIPCWLDRIAALGNAVVPQIPMLFGRFIREVEEGER